ncbi:MAG TPA: hypothetical protein VHC68_01600 [Candidatus Paceibacterota bacterium]|nr:hypothetical protein [Candidatus Paceibacterota bacterium]
MQTHPMAVSARSFPDNGLRDREMIVSHLGGTNYFAVVEPPMLNQGRGREDAEPYICVAWIESLLLCTKSGSVEARVSLDGDFVDAGYLKCDHERQLITPCGFKHRLQNSLGKPLQRLHPHLGDWVLGDRLHLHGVSNRMRERALQLSRQGGHGIVHVGFSPKIKH